VAGGGAGGHGGARVLVRFWLAGGTSRSQFLTAHQASGAH
jgi:hypothetical protein